MKVFADLHHSDLYYSLHLLFEKRLGMELYRPIGFDWFDEGFWKIAEPYGNARDTVGQYLEISDSGWDQYKALNGTHSIDENGIYRVWDPGHDYHHRAITLAQFKEMDFDIVVSSIPAHDLAYRRLIDQYMPKAKHIVQMGNINQSTSGMNVLSSVPFRSRPDQNVCTYHQEIDLQQYRFVEPDPNTQKVTSMVNLLPFRNIYEQFKGLLPEVEFKAYGASCPDGSLPGCAGVAGGMREANLGWHCKPHDGFGHNAMGWFASGRGVITKMSDVVWYGHDAPQLFVPDVTCINVEEPQDIVVQKIRRWLEPEENLKAAERARSQFFNVVNYDEEELKIRTFMENLK